MAQWNQIFPGNMRNRRFRVCLGNSDTAARVADAFFPKSDSSRGKVVVEAYPGPGVLTRALLQLPPGRIRKLIVLEDIPEYYEKVKELEAHDPRVVALNLDALSWDTYTEIEQRGLLDDLEKRNWEDASDVEFVCHMPHSLHGEQFTAQLLRSIPQKSWLFTYGRMPMHLILAESLYDRVLGSSRRTRCKLSIIAEATTSFQYSIQPGDLKPYIQHFWPPPITRSSDLPESRKAGHPMVASTFMPLPEQHIGSDALDEWDYCLRRLYVLKNTTLDKAVSSLAPGAHNLLASINKNLPAEQHINVKAKVNELSVKDWATLVKAFKEWPFAPDVRMISNRLS
ncbi:hypothetical protein Clacol_000703 [Clathrus columnatus]|uniref:rRNA adenine N(6)-methyltransferase n=1 Tax=Clathrus columnatus TaxID=1419009 RepID=A0AAV4ZWZ4_9AGAM|nr:hypothetical protein Clacol_000703 [Clathrus columnatus]